MKKRTKIVIVSAICLFIAACAGGFFALKKISAMGGFHYIYNSKHPTKGDLPAEYHGAAELAADGKPYATVETDPSVLAITQKIRIVEDGQTRIIMKEPGTTDEAGQALTGTTAEAEQALMGTTDEAGFSRTEPISFDLSLNTIPGIYTFRGNYHRDMSSYGKAKVQKERFAKDMWSYETGKLLKSNGTDYWSGNGWTGQPLIIEWPEETKKIMNLYPDKKLKKNFVEVIYSGMDGYVHFLDLEDGSESRDKIHIGMVFKGTASLYPNGIPMLILGSGDSQTGLFGENVSPRAYIYSLIDGSKLYEFGYNDSFAPRVFHAYDSSPVVDVKTDTLIYPGENGIMYSMKLNTKYDSAAGTLSVSPDHMVDFTYSAERATESAYTWGMENSASVNGQYLYVGDNGGVFQCIDLNTMTTVWAQDLLSDVNSSPIFSEEENGNFVYVATTLTQATIDSHNNGEVAIFKLNAANGSIVWKKAFECHNVDGVEGGILATGVLGKDEISGQIIYSISRSPKLTSGILISLNKKNGETVWMQELSTYAWSSTVTMYSENGAVYLIQCLADGKVLLMNAANGYLLDTIDLHTTLEATPAVFGNRIVIGTRDKRIVGIKVE